MKSYVFPIFIIFIVSVLFSSCDYNKITSLDAKVQIERQKVEHAYKQKIDLAQRFINILKSEAPNEKQTLKAAIAARSQAFNAKLNPKDLSPEKIQKYESTQNDLSSTLSDLLQLINKYPKLVVSSEVKSLKAQLKNADAQILVMCKAYNESLINYNALVTSSPTSIYAGIIGYKKRGEFKAGLKTEN